MPSYIQQKASVQNLADCSITENSLRDKNFLKNQNYGKHQGLTCEYLEPKGGTDCGYLGLLFQEEQVNKKPATTGIFSALQFS